MKKLTERLRRNALLDVLFSLKGNPRACIWVEPLWGIPYTLYLPYVTLFMTAIGLSYAEVGYITSITMVSQMVCAVLSGVLTDKLGRRKCTVIFDTLSWSVPELLWMLSQNFTWFAVAAVFNGMWRITENSWYLLLIEDAEKDQAIALNSLSQIMGLIAAFVAPLSKFAVDAFGVVPTMRVLYGFACVSMTAKFWILYYWGTETRNGLRRMEATKNQSIFKMLWECKDIYLRIIREKRMLLTLAILSLYMLVTTLNGNYWSLYICDVLGIREGDVSLFVTFKSLVTMCCSFLLVAKIRYQSIRWPMLASLAAFALSQALLLIPLGPVRVPALVLSVALEAIAVAVLGPVTGSLVFINAEEDERARIVGMVYATVALVVSLFPSLVGMLAQRSLRFPFYVNLGLFAVLAVLAIAISRLPAADENT